MGGGSAGGQSPKARAGALEPEPEPEPELLLLLLLLLLLVVVVVVVRRRGWLSVLSKAEVPVERRASVAGREGRRGSSAVGIRD